jgi:DNA-binding transcriptional regulator YiaG
MPSRPRVPEISLFQIRETIRAQMKLHTELPPPAEMRAIRERAGLSLHDVAKAIGCTHAAVGFWETGARTPQGEMLHRYMEALRTMQEA